MQNSLGRQLLQNGYQDRRDSLRIAIEIASVKLWVGCIHTATQVTVPSPLSAPSRARGPLRELVRTPRLSTSFSNASRERLRSLERILEDDDPFKNVLKRLTFFSYSVFTQKKHKQCLCAFGNNGSFDSTSLADSRLAASDSSVH